MPSDLKPEDGWISSDQLTIPAQVLAQSEVKDYLTWQFSDLAKKPKALMLRETASVVRFLSWLGLQGIPKKIKDRGEEAIREYWNGSRAQEEIEARQAVEATAKIVWADLLSFGQFEPSSKRQALRFFRERSSDWHHPWFQPALRFLEDFELPRGAKLPFRRQNLVGRHLSAQGDGNPYLTDDLSERITAADYALKRAGIRRRRALIAKALDESPLTRRAHGPWVTEEVGSRVKAYQKQRHHLPGDALADRWLVSYRFALSVRQQPRVEPEPKDNQGA